LQTLIKTIQAEDHEFIKDEAAEIAGVATSLERQGIRCDVGHPERFWEYGFALQTLRGIYPQLQGRQVLDVGAGWSPLGPTLAGSRVLVSEVEIDFACYPERKKINELLGYSGYSAINWIQGTASSMQQHAELFDAVFCISVMEHVDRAYELKMWADLAKLVAPGGLLFITCDCVPDRGPKVFDNLRQTNYMTQDLMARISNLESNYQMEPLLGQPDYDYHGNFVYDYTFFMAAMRKKL
jgi:hypothetical protein